MTMEMMAGVGFQGKKTKKHHMKMKPINYDRY